jgi:hypothetical protein
VLGPETAPNGAFDRVGPKWQQLRPDEGEKLAIIPEGWLVGYQGGVRTMPLAARDPGTGDRCMDFLYGAGRVDLLTPPFPLDGPGTYLLSMRTRSVVKPTDHALRAIVRLLPAEAAPGPPTSAPSPPQDRGAVADARLGAGPAEKIWSTRTALVQVRASFGRAEIHLVKDDDLADFLVDDVSLRRIVAAPPEIAFDVPPGAPGWTSPVLYLGAIDAASAGLVTIVASPPATSEGAPIGGAKLEWRTGVSTSPGDLWEAWRPVEPDARAEGDLHLFAKGAPLFGQVRVTIGAGLGARRVRIRLTPSAGPRASSAITFTALRNPEAGSGDAWRAIALPPEGSCRSGELAPFNPLALEATAGSADDLSRARALRDALRRWAPFTAAGGPPATSDPPAPAELLEDCGRPTPRDCRGREGDLVTAACHCSGLICRGVSSAAAGAPGKGIEGFEVWSRELGRWAFLSFDGDTASEPPVPGTALEMSESLGVPVAIALDLRWGRRGYAVGGAAGALEFPIDQVHVDLAAAGERAFRIEIDHDVPGFHHLSYRLAPSIPWRTVPPAFEWRLVPGDNRIEIRAENILGGSSAVTELGARIDQDARSRAAPYAGLRALGGDPHVHTGLGLYRIVDPDHPLVVGTPEGAFEAALRNGLDWAAVTDYSQDIDDPRSIAWRVKDHHLLRNPDGSETASEWEHLEAVVRKANQPGRFAAFLGVEFDGGGFSSKGGTGRKIILLPDESPETYCSSSVLDVGDCPLVEDAFRYARTHGGVMIASTPCAVEHLEDTDWSRYDPVVALLEIYGGACESAPGGLREVAIRRGLPVGAGGGSDSRKGIAGLFDRTVCWATEASRGPILDAIRARRCYWSAAGHLDLAFSIDGAPMGSTIEPAPATAWSIEAVSGSAPPFAGVELLRNGEVIAAAPCETASRCLLEGGVGEAWPGVYYAAIDGTDGARLAVSSPIRVLAGDDAD